MRSSVFCRNHHYKEEASRPSLAGLQLYIHIHKHQAKALNSRSHSISHSFARKGYVSLLPTSISCNESSSTTLHLRAKVLEESQRPGEHVCPFKYVYFKYTFTVFLFVCLLVLQSPTPQHLPLSTGSYGLCTVSGILLVRLLPHRIY